MSKINETKLRELAVLLGRPLPRGFSWDFVSGYEADRDHPTRACGCAIGLAAHTGLIEGQINGDIVGMAMRGFGLSHPMVMDLFFDLKSAGTGANTDTGPKVVARGIRAFLRRRKARGTK